MDAQRGRSLDITFKLHDNLGTVEGRTGLRPTGIQNGDNIPIEIGQINHGGPMTDQLFVQTVIHEFIHTFGNPTWDARLDAPNSQWDRELFFQLKFNELMAPSGQIVTSQADSDVRPLIVGDLNGGEIHGLVQPGVLIGTIYGNTFHMGSAGDTAIGANGADTYIAQTGGGIDIIQDDGGSDTLVLASVVAPTSVSALWSPDGRDLSIYVDGNLEAIGIDAGSSGAIEYLRLNGTNYSLAAFVTGTNAAPVAPAQTIDIYGTAPAGALAYIVASDPNDDLLHFTLLDVAGEFADLPWYVNDLGTIFTDFTRLDSPGNSLTYLTVRVDDGVSSVDTTVTISWGYSGDYDPTSISYQPVIAPLDSYLSDIALVC